MGTLLNGRLDNIEQRMDRHNKTLWEKIDSSNKELHKRINSLAQHGDIQHEKVHGRMNRMKTWLVMVLGTLGMTLMMVIGLLVVEISKLG